jgi:transposase
VGLGASSARPRLRDLQAVLAAGPAPCGWPDLCWTLARIAEGVWTRYGVDYILAGLDLLLHRIGLSVQVPARRAAERNETTMAGWARQRWPVVKGRRRSWAPGSASKTRPARG